MIIAAAVWLLCAFRLGGSLLLRTLFGRGVLGPLGLGNLRPALLLMAPLLAGRFFRLVGPLDPLGLFPPPHLFGRLLAAFSAPSGGVSAIRPLEGLCAVPAALPSRALRDRIGRCVFPFLRLPRLRKRACLRIFPAIGLPLPAIAMRSGLLTGLRIIFLRFKLRCKPFGFGRIQGQALVQEGSALPEFSVLTAGNGG